MKDKEAGTATVTFESSRLCERSPSPRGEGWGEGEGSKLQPTADDDSRNRQTSSPPAEPGVSQIDYDYFIERLE